MQYDDVESNCNHIVATTRIIRMNIPIVDRLPTSSFDNDRQHLLSVLLKTCWHLKTVDLLRIVFAFVSFCSLCVFFIFTFLLFHFRIVRCPRQYYKIPTIINTHLFIYISCWSGIYLCSLDHRVYFNGWMFFFCLDHGRKLKLQFGCVFVVVVLCGCFCEKNWYFHLLVNLIYLYSLLFEYIQMPISHLIH